jgi:tetratricopeptide (TPR) repeat protein
MNRSDTLPPLWNIPYRRNPFFTGREETLSHLYASLSAENAVALADPLGITGLGGVGKTQTALEYAYRYSTEYSAVFWVYADSIQALISSLIRLAHMLNLPERNEQDQYIIVEAVLRWLRLHTGWLLIFDNVEDFPVIEPFLPKGGSGHILFTTRVHGLSGFAQRLDVQKMEPDTGALLLLRRAAILPLQGTLKQSTTDDQNVAREIAHVLGGLPLALDQAGAYIKEMPCSLQNYLAQYQVRHQELLQARGSFDQEYLAAVATTWSLSFEKVHQANPAAAVLLDFCAFLAPDAIPEEMIMGGAPYLDSPLQDVVIDPVLFDQAIMTLLAYSLVDRHANNDTLSIHRLVQTVLQDALLPEKKMYWMERVVLLANSAFPSGDFATWIACERLLSHVLIGADWIKQEHMVFPEAMRLLNQAGYYLEKRAQYDEAEPLYLRARTICERQMGAEHPNFATILNNIALLYSDQGKYREAEPLYLQALAIREKGLGPEHPEVAQSLSNLAGLYRDQGKYAVAEPLYQRALTIAERQLRPDHLNTATSLNNLADIYRLQEKCAEAEVLYKWAQIIYERQLGGEHPDTATSLNNLAILYKEQGKYAEAEPLLMRFLEIREQFLGSQHPETAQCLNNLAMLYSDQGKYTEAEPLLKRALNIRERQLGGEHPDTATSLNNLAVLYKKQGRYAEAELLYMRALTIYERHQGLEHSSIALVLNNLADLYQQQRKYTEAEPLLKQALAIYEQQLGAQHPSTASVLNNLALLYKEQGKYTEAEPLLKQALFIWEQKWGSMHLSIAHCLNNLAALYDDQGKHAEAEPLYLRALRIQEQQLEAMHPSIASSLNNLASLYQNQGKYAQAEPLYRRALTIFELTLGQEHPFTQTIQQNYATLLQSMKYCSET